MPSLANRLAMSLARAPVDLRHLIPGIRQQGPRPLCVAFAATTVHEAARALIQANPAADQLSVEPLWQHCVNRGRGDHNGTTISDAAIAMDDRGHPAEVSWPYNDTLGAGTEPDPPTTAHVDWHCANLLDLPIAHDGIEDLVELALAAGFAIILLVELTHEFEYPGADGEISVPVITSPLGDYHAVVAVGAATSADGTTRRLLIRNSWGTGWGAGGYGWMPLEYLTAFAVEAAVLDPRTMLSY
jgi:C1A family cysteine protease